MSGPEPDSGAIAFAEKVLTVLGEGRFTATYKYAVLLGLMDLCLEHSTRSGAAPTSVSTRQLAEKVLDLYWPQVVPFEPQSEATLLQNAGAQAKIVEAIGRFRARHAPDPSAPLSCARAGAERAYERLVARIEWTLIQMPLPRLQIVGESEDPFLYRINWDTSVRQSDLHGDFDNSIRFVGDAGDHLVRLAGLLRPLLQREWAAMVARLNQEVVPNARLEEFLFGAGRISTEPVRDRLVDLAGARCFYCAAKVGGEIQLDHFIPWVRYPDNGIENLVVSDSRCNGAKRDHLAAADHVERWVERARVRASDFDSIARSASWEHHADRTLGVGRSIYLRLPPRVRLWRRAAEFVSVDRGRLARAFGA